MPRETVDYYWSYRSHYCYLSIGRVLDIARRYPVDIRLRPVYPLAIRMPEFFASIPRTGPDRWAYVRRDVERIAQRFEIPFGWPDPDPVVMDMKTFSIADEQPYIYRLTRLGVEASRRGKGLEFAAAVSRLIFGGTPGWDRGDAMRRAVAAADLDLDEMDRRLAADPEDYDAEAAANEAALAAAGHWGTPTLVIRGEPFFGQDRLDDFRWRLEKLGLGRR